MTNKKQKQQILKSIQELEKKSPKSIELLNKYIEYADILYREKFYKEAKDNYVNTIILLEKVFPSTTIQGTSSIKIGGILNAISIATVFDNCISCYEKLNQKEGAKILSKKYKECMKHISNLTKEADKHFTLGQYKEAEVYYKSFIQEIEDWIQQLNNNNSSYMNKYFSDVYLNYATICYELKDLTNAAIYYKKYIEIKEKELPLETQVDTYRKFSVILKTPDDSGYKL